MAFGYFTYFFYRGHFVYNTQEIIDTEIRHLTRSIGQADLRLTLENIMSYENRVYVLYDSDGTQAMSNIDIFPDHVSVLDEGIVVLNIKERDKIFAAKIHTFDNGQRLLIGIDISDVQKDFGFMRKLSILSIVFMLMVIATSYIISQFVVTHTNRIAQTAKDIIDTGDFSRRIDVDSDWDDLSYMASVLNALFARVHELMAGVQRVSNNIAHDLRTPLTRMRNNLEALKTMDAMRVCPDAQEKSDSLIAEADQLLSTFNALLRISRIETGKQKSQFAPVDLCHILGDVIDLYEPIADEKEIKITSNLQKCTDYFGDRDLLFQGFANLLDNAIKFTPEAGEINIELVHIKKNPVIIIKDNGTGVLKEERAKIFDRFYRTERSRTSQGNGLGLSLVAAIMNLHYAKIDVFDCNPGLGIKISF